MKSLLASILSWVKAHKKAAAVVAALAILVVFFGLRSCRVGPAEKRAIKAEAIAEQTAQAAKEAERQYALDRSVWAMQKKDLDKKIEAAMDVIATISGQLDSSNFTLAQLEEILAQAKTFEEKYYAQVPIIAELKKRETSYWKPLIDEQDKIILSLKQEVAGERRLRLESEKLVEYWKAAAEKYDRESRAKDGVITRLKFQKNLGLVGSAAAFGFGLLIGK